MSTQDALKAEAAEAAVAEIQDGMVLGLGTGTTAALAVAALGRRVAAGLRVTGIPTSEATAKQARGLGIPLTTLAEHPVIDLTIDGADAVHTGTLDLIKGLGGALLREKIVATASRRMIVIVDGSKLTDHLGSGVRLPVEIVPFGWQATRARLGRFMPNMVLRQRDGAPYVTDNGNYLLDCLVPIPDPAALAAQLKSVTGVVDHGLFIGLASRVIAATEQGVRILDRP